MDILSEIEKEIWLLPDVGQRTTAFLELDKVRKQLEGVYEMMNTKEVRINPDRAEAVITALRSIDYGNLRLCACFYS